MTDYPVESTIYLMFTTRQFSTGAPFTLAGTPAVAAYENESLTQITAGITLGVDHDSVTGLNLLTIVASGANGYESGKDYHMVITTGTVDSVSVVGEVVGRFTLGRSAAAVDLANGTDGLGAIKAETAAILDDTDLIDDGTSGLAKIATDVAAILVDTGTTLDANITAILADTNELQGDWANGGRLDLILDAVLDDTDLIDDGTSGLAKIATDVAAVLVDTAVIGAAGAGLTEAGGTGDHLTAVPWNAAWDAEVQSEVNDGLVALGLDHLLAVAVAGTDVADDSVVASLVSNNVTADWDDYDNTFSSHEALANLIDDVASEVAPLNNNQTEPTTGVGTANASPILKIGYLYKWARNQVDVTATKKTFYNDAGTADAEKDLSDDGTTYSESELNSV